MDISALTTDFYELTMMQGYFETGHNPQVVFDMFYRTNPYNGGYVVFTGLNELLDKIESFRFSEEDIEYLRGLHTFTDEFLDYLKDMRFSGDIYAFSEGSIVFPGEPLVRIHTSLIEAQLIESFLLNTLNFQSLIATKAARAALAANHSPIMEFGLRRAQGEGHLAASRACYIGGCASTSNTIAGKLYDIPVAGTMAHSWVMSFPSELESFRKFAALYPDNCILLIDTYDTLRSGIENAIIVGLEQKKKGKKIGVRIDSGDLSYLSRKIRKRLDDAGLEDATICVSNDLNELIIKTLVNDKVPIDSWGVGTHLVTGGTQSSLNGVYKLSAKVQKDEMVPTMKISNSSEKTTNPGIKQVYRFIDKEGNALADLITLDEEAVELDRKYIFYHPFIQGDFFVMKNYDKAIPMLKKQMENGKRITPSEPLKEIRERVKENLKGFHPSYLRQINPHIYKVSLSEELKRLKFDLMFKEKEKQFEASEK